MASPTPPSTGPYVRVAESHEFDEAAQILARAFARDPAMNWYGGVKEIFPPHADIRDYNALPPRAKATLKGLHTFQSALVRATILSGGFITVAVIPNEMNGDEVGEDGRTKKETIAGVTLWLKPGQTMDFPVMTIMRSGILKIQRVLLDFSPAVERSLVKSFKAHDMDRVDSWHLLEMVVDPEHEGKGLCGLMMRDGFERTAPKPVHLEATTPRTREIYAHYGFEVDEEHQFGMGSVDVNGIVAKGAAATGYPEWVMTKVGALIFAIA
ncbi:hypothetical protein EIP86_004651 [Pleurotus ostreatoroseus]|nr:hypothetical protein EIP86_004651 [Pleurotus ostreatoroseus]